MKTTNTNRLSALKAYQIAAIAALTSTLAAVSVLFVVRESVKRWAARILRDGAASRPPGYVTPASPATTADHFTETLLIPGITESGSQIARRDAEEGRSPEGV